MGPVCPKKKKEEMGKGKNKSKNKGKGKRGKPPKEVRQRQSKKQPEKDPAVQDRENIIEYLAQLKGRTQDGEIRGICVIELGTPTSGNRIRWVGNVPPGEVTLPLLTLQRLFVDMALNPQRQAVEVPSSGQEDAEAGEEEEGDEGGLEDEDEVDEEDEEDEEEEDDEDEGEDEDEDD